MNVSIVQVTVGEIKSAELFKNIEAYLFGIYSCRKCPSSSYRLFPSHSKQFLYKPAGLLVLVCNIITAALRQIKTDTLGQQNQPNRILSKPLEKKGTALFCCWFFFFNQLGVFFLPRSVFLFYVCVC